MVDPITAIRATTLTLAPTPLLMLEGVLDRSSYRTVRNAVIKAALDEPPAVLVDVSALSVPAASAWSAFTSARWHVSVWPDVPILLICPDARMRADITAGGMSRYVPVHATLRQALAAVPDTIRDARRRARSRLPRSPDASALTRSLVRDWLTGWARTDLIPAATIVATVFIDNVLEHTGSPPELIVEATPGTVTIAAEDGSHRPASRLEETDRGFPAVSGLAVVAALCRSWGCTPTGTGKTVWALLGPENVL